MDMDSIRETYPQYSGSQLAQVASIYGEAAALQARVEALTDFRRRIAQSALDQVTRILADKVPAE